MSFATPLAWYWVLTPVLVAVLAAILLMRVFIHVAHGRLTHGGAHAASGLILALVALCTGLIVLQTQSLARRTAERAVADITVAAFNPRLNLYRVTVDRLDGANTRTVCSIEGDEWLLSARVQKWRSWAMVLGLDSTYSLDQITNKYFTAERGNGNTITACSLATTPDDGPFRSLADWLADQSYIEHRRFGSAVYMPLTDGAIYRVLMTQNGLNAEPVNPIARTAVAQRL
jgi:hypothetical protein